MEFITRTNTAVRRFESSETIRDNVSYYTFRIEFETTVQPSEFEIRFSLPAHDVNGIWQPLGSFFTEVSPNWSPRRVDSALASGMPLLVGCGADGNNRFTLALSDVKRPSSLSCGVTEETGEMQFAVKLFTGLIAPLDRYEVTLRFDKRPLSFAEAVKSAAAWWENEIGWLPCPVPDASRRPVYSTWYNFHHHMTPDAMLEELKIAKSLGCDTIMVDGGWYHDSTQRGAHDSGDWIPAKSKVGEGRSFTDACHALGVKVVYWFGVPFIGRTAKSHEKFIGKYLYDTSEGLGASILDPRFADVREFIISGIIRCVRNLGLDGVKFDFVDMFTLRQTSPQNTADMDIPVLEDAVEALMTALYRSLTALDPDMIIEFRQSYVGPAIRAFGNILRVGDCPYSGRTNARCACDLRLTSGSTAIHTDMTMWEKGTSAADAARQLWLGLFAVPQISVMLRELPEEHLAVVKRFLAYWKENRSLLLDGEFDCSAPLGTYAWMSAKADEREIKLLITENAVTPVTDSTDIVNLTGTERIYLDLTGENGARRVVVTDFMGKLLSDQTLACGAVHRLKVPDAALVQVCREFHKSSQVG